MRGTIAAIAPDGTYGQIAAEDGKRYSYWTSEIRNGPGRPGQAVDFELWQGQPVNIFIQTAGAPKAAPQRPPQQADDPPQQAAAFTSAAPRFGASQPSAFAQALSAVPVDYWLRLFGSPVGRISRRQFWLHGVLPIIVASLLLGWIPIVGLLVTVAVVWASICISFKRFHDVGYPGWWSLASTFAAVMAMVLTAGAYYVNGLGLLAGVLWVVTALVGLAQLVFVYIQVGQEGPNPYGPDPLTA